MKYHATQGFEPKPHSHTHNLCSRPKPKRSPIKIHDGFIKPLGKLWSKM